MLWRLRNEWCGYRLGLVVRWLRVGYLFLVLSRYHLTFLVNYSPI
uniref:Uncharacterized protein n=1 Tax=Podoviridae sp. ctEmK1 TaxID=2827727 RepID=A0A8S5S525_9CAUD|nr:MAG TPA: hypothetical protein [Podoviridae sp. ctEmK1]